MFHVVEHEMMSKYHYIDYHSCYIRCFLSPEKSPTSLWSRLLCRNYLDFCAFCPWPVFILYMYEWRIMIQLCMHVCVCLRWGVLFFSWGIFKGGTWASPWLRGSARSLRGRIAWSTHMQSSVFTLRTDNWTDKEFNYWPFTVSGSSSPSPLLRRQEWESRNAVMLM